MDPRQPLAVTIRPLTPPRWKDLEAIFKAPGCSIPRGCWCMYYRESGRPELPHGAPLADVRRKRLRALVDAGPPPGLIAYAGRTPVGWVTLGPRAEFRKLERSPVMKPVDAAPVWSIVCFVVPPAYRHRGVAAALLQGAVAYAKKRGARIVEAYPVDKAERGRDDWLWHGAKSMYDKAGFREVARRKPTRPVVRIELAKSR
jgi:ribosomal protein S18 acetylase RimI-like enzyme